MRKRGDITSTTSWMNVSSHECIQFEVTWEKCLISKDWECIGKHILPFMGFLGQVLTYNDWCVKRTSFLRTEDAKKNFCVLSTEIFLVKEFSFNIDVYYVSYFKENSLVFYMESQQ